MEPARREPFLTNFGRIETLYRTGRINEGLEAGRRLLDFRVSRPFQLGWGSLTAYIDIFNVYNRQNATSVNQLQFYLQPDGSIGSFKTYDGGMSLLPSFGVKLDF